MIRTLALSLTAICCPSTIIMLGVMIRLARTAPLATEDELHGFRRLDDAS